MGRFFRWVAVGFGLLFLVPIAVAAWSLLQREKIESASVLHITLDGPLAETPRSSLAGLVGGRMHTTLHTITAGIRRAASDDRIVGLVLDVRTPALGLAQIGEITDAMAEFRKSHKWNVAYLESAGELGRGDGVYALACAADQIFLSPPGEINLAGLRAEVPFVKEALARLHVNAYTEQRHEFKNFANTFTHDDFTPEHKEALKAVLDDLQDTLLGAMATGRKVTAAQARQWVENAPYSAAEALKAHLVDKVAYWDELQAEAEKVAGRKKPFTDPQSYDGGLRLPHGEEVAYIVGAGQITQGDGGKSPLEATDGIGSDTMAQAFREARADEVKGVLLRIDSPGGSYIASDLIRREVELTRKAGIPVVVSMGNVAASGGYFIAADADHIVVEPGSITGSIGVFAASFALRDFLHHWLGVSFGVYETVPHAGNLQWLDPPTPADRARIGKTLDRIYGDFVTKVANGRHKTYDEVHALARGRIWSGRQAVKNGLADELGGIETALAYLRQRLGVPAGEALHLVPYPEPDNALTMIRELVSQHGEVAAPWRPLLTQLQRLIAPPRDTVLLAPW